MCGFQRSKPFPPFQMWSKVWVKHFLAIAYSISSFWVLHAPSNPSGRERVPTAKLVSRKTYLAKADWLIPRSMIYMLGQPDEVLNLIRETRCDILHHCSANASPFLFPLHTDDAGHGHAIYFGKRNISRWVTIISINYVCMSWLVNVCMSWLVSCAFWWSSRRLLLRQ